jgi:hypothetical protein
MSPTCQSAMPSLVHEQDRDLNDRLSRFIPIFALALQLLWVHIYRLWRSLNHPRHSFDSTRVVRLVPSCFDVCDEHADPEVAILDCYGRPHPSV